MTICDTTRLLFPTHTFGPAGVSLGSWAAALGVVGDLTWYDQDPREGCANQVKCTDQWAAHIYYPAAGLVTLHAPRDQSVISEGITGTLGAVGKRYMVPFAGLTVN